MDSINSSIDINPQPSEMQSLTPPSPNSTISDPSQVETLTSVPGPSTLRRPSTSNASGPRLTGAALARKKKLEEDPLTSDVKMSSILCLSCGHRIRLSTRSLYDNHHWKRHKDRCIKRVGHVMVPTEQNPSSSKSKSARRAKPKAKPKPKPRRAFTPPSSVSSLTSLSTPSLTSGEEEDMSGPEELKSTLRSMTVKTTDLPTQQYLAYAHGLRTGLPPVARDHWRMWSWSELRMAEFSGAGAYTLTQSEASSSLAEDRAESSVRRKDGAEDLRPQSKGDHNSAAREPYSFC